MLVLRMNLALWVCCRFTDDQLLKCIPVPRWLGNESVRSGIKAQLIIDRCNEECERLRKERCTMQVWLQEEWASLMLAIADAGAHSYDLKKNREIEFI